ncbi:MAG: hypothetical protein Q4C87_02380 [Actinomycetaceae bacterium]|nr:hypothetical protein [Actinomycetaceae bacterium]
MSAPSPYNPSAYPPASQGGQGQNPQSAHPYSSQQPAMPASPPPGVYASAGGPTAPGNPLGAAVKPLNIMGIIGLVILVIRDLANPLQTLFISSSTNATQVGLYLGMFTTASVLLSAVALVFGIVGLRRRQTRAHWTALAATTLAAWHLVFMLYSTVAHMVLGVIANSSGAL